MTDAKIWGVFVGDAGNQLVAFNSKNGPFPPEPGTMGFIAIGWSAVGDLRMYEGDYADYINKFRKIYPHNDERAFKTQANMPWKFAHEMKEDEWVICPSSSAGYLLVGKLVDGYLPDFHDESGLFRTKERADFLHLRKVRWLYIVSDKDSRYYKLNKIGQLTVSNPSFSVDQLKAILNGSDE
jgi:predicted Mrr-cat superfamily restriction endonuclease